MIEFFFFLIFRANSRPTYLPHTGASEAFVGTCKAKTLRKGSLICLRGENAPATALYQNSLFRVPSITDYPQ